MDIRPHPIKPPIVRFMALIKVSTEHFHDGTPCWDWQGSTGTGGYGQFTLSAKAREVRQRIAPYKFIWEHFNGPMPEGLEPDHMCNRRPCCNPEHIEPVTHAENRRKRPNVDYRCTKVRGTRCPKGHQYTAENMYTSPKGAIYCRACNRAACLAYQAKKRAA